MPHAQQLGRYQLLDRIAFGGMAEIFRAKTFDQEGRVHMVAVKRVLNHLTQDEDFLRMLVDEARLTALIQHDNVAQVYEFSHTDDEYFIAMEYVDGKDVRVLLERHRVKKAPVAPEHVAWIVMEVAHALHAAHRQRDSNGRAMHIVHRDVSPSNVLLSYNGEVKLCDFGIAKATLTRVQTKTGVIKGKVKYMSPEQAMGRRLDHRSDLFSLGTVMYEMLTMEAPFQAATEVELIFAVRDAMKRSAREIVPSIPEELNDILDKLMSRSRSQRYQSGEELAMALRIFLDRYRPGYRRSHFGRYMRQEFADDIEKELRLLEEYVIDNADPTKVGENLLADVLGPHAVYTQFTAAAAAEPAETPYGTTSARAAEESTLAPHGELHALPTKILNPAAEPPTPAPAELHALETKILTMPREGQPREEGFTAESTIGGKLHELETKILALPTQSIHELKTKILKRDQVLGTPNVETGAQTLPAPPKVVVDEASKEHVDEDEQTSVPIKDDDLEPV
jgi:serine/threonine-protein kinase